MKKSEGYKSEGNITEYMLDSLRANGSKGGYLQLVGSLFNVIGDSLGLYGQIISMIEDEQSDREKQQQQQQMQNQIDQLQQELQQQQQGQKEKDEQIDQVYQFLKTLQINPKLQQTYQGQQVEDMKQQIYLQEQIYIT